jgi:hypothetical protein
MANPLSQLDEAGDAVRKVIRAYHGSPYDFDRFDAKKIGSGEGAQSYGHGLYFAESPETAEVYRQALSGGQANNLVSDDELRAFYAPGRIVKDNDKVLRFIENQEEPWNWRVEVIGVDGSGAPLPGERPRIHHTTPTVREYDRSFGLPLRRTGKAYEVEIGYPESSLLDFDAPVSEQSGIVRDAVRSLLGADAVGLRGKVAHDNIAKFYGDDLSDAGAARALLENGVPGTRYFDGLSRTEQKGTRNYVMFPGTEDSIRILRKYGMLAPIAAGATADE